MIPARFRNRFLVRGVFWRQFLRWAVRNVPIWFEPAAIAFWTAFFLLWGPGRRGVMLNLKAILPGSTRFSNFFRTYRVFWNFAWTIADNARFNESRIVPDWEFVGFEYFDALQSSSSGAIMLTAHMGSYDLGAHLFALTSARRIVMVRAPEADPDTRAYEEGFHGRTADDGLHVGFNTRTSDLALDLLDDLHKGSIVAIQGDRVTEGIAARKVSLFGRTTLLPSGPFALAMAARVPIYPLFVMRAGRRRYRLVALPPIEVTRTGRDRDADLGRAIDLWVAGLEQAVRDGWQQWFTFDTFYVEQVA